MSGYKIQWPASLIVAAFIFNLLASSFVFGLVLTKWAGVTTSKLRGQCAHHRGVAQLDHYLMRHDTQIVVCRDGSIHKVWR